MTNTIIKTTIKQVLFANFLKEFSVQLMPLIMNTSRTLNIP